MMKSLGWLTLATGVVLFAGCNTFEKRSQEKAAAFSALDPQTQSRLKQGQINISDTFDMVYIALGAPDEKRDKLAAGSQQTIWTFNSYWQEYRGEVLLGYRRYVVQDPRTKTYRVYFEPVRESVYEQRSEERIRITFENGKVTVVEQAQR